MQESLHYERLPNNSVRCNLCPNGCIIAPGKVGICRGRKNIEGTLYSINYGECVSLAMDPIEKKPLYHFSPGSFILSTASNSCNFRCPYCQNAEISQEECPTHYISPEELVNIALRKKSVGIAYTYTEPLTWFEYVVDTAKIAREHGLKNVLVTNGMINEKPLMELLPYIDAANIDLKSMDPGFYKNLIHGDLDTVLNTIRITKLHWHIELTNLLIPGYNDSPDLISRLVDFVESIGEETPLHFSRYFPHYKFTVPATPIRTLEFAANVAKKKLYYVYIGNVWMNNGFNTYCPGCGNLLVNRSYFGAPISGISEGKCTRCGRRADFVL